MFRVPPIRALFVAERRPQPGGNGLVADQAYSDGTWIYCSGTLISPTVFLTAAHCGEGGRVRVTFDSAYQEGDKVYGGTFYGDPLCGGAQSDPHDIAVVVLDKKVGIAPAKLPASGSLAGLPANQRFTSVGYGAYEVTNSPGGHQYLYDDVRHPCPAGWHRSESTASHGKRVFPGHGSEVTGRSR